MTTLTAELEDSGIAILEDGSGDMFRVHYDLYQDEGFAGMHRGTYCDIDRVEAIDEDETDEDQECIVWVEIGEHEMNRAFGLSTIQPHEVKDAILQAEEGMAGP